MTKTTLQTALEAYTNARNLEVEAVKARQTAIDLAKALSIEDQSTWRVKTVELDAKEVRTRLSTTREAPKSMPKAKKHPSRADRREQIAAGGCGTLEVIKDLFDQIEDRLCGLEDCQAELEELAGEYQNWADNMPENLQGSGKHEEVETAATSLQEAADQITEQIGALRSFSDALGEIEAALQLAQEVELPGAYGR